MTAMQQIREYEANANGSEELHSYSPFRSVRITDGCKLVANVCSAFWLIDAICSHQVNRKAITKCNGFQHWKLTMNKSNSGCVLECFDGGQNGNKSVCHIRQRIEFTDFPMPRGECLEFYFEDGVLMLKCER